MLENTIPPLRTAQPRQTSGVYTWLLSGGLLVVLIFGLWQASRPHVINLASTQLMRDLGVYRAWDSDEVIVVLRHAERCDRSTHQCLNDPAGITVEGSQAAAAVGQGISRLGLAGADILSSPEIRTQQTASYVFGKAIETQDWLAQCNKDFAGAALSHKREGHNLMLVTHSGCIEHLEQQLGVPKGNGTAGYASALFISADSHGKARLLGQLNASQWQTLVSTAGK